MTDALLEVAGLTTHKRRVAPRRRGGRVAEGGGLLNRYTGSTRIVSSNLIPSANFPLFIN